MNEGDAGASRGTEPVTPTMGSADLRSGGGHTAAGPHADHSRTQLGRELRELRRRILESGAQLLGWDELDLEVARRRGERTSS
jgi:hypothetical protein